MSVVPAEAGIQDLLFQKTALDPGFRRGDGLGAPVWAERTTDALACTPPAAECLPSDYLNHCVNAVALL